MILRRNIYILLIFTMFTSKLFCQKPDSSDWKVFMDDSLILVGNAHLRYSERPRVIIDIAQWQKMKNLKFTFRNREEYEARIVFKENGKLLFRIGGYYADKTVEDTISYPAKYFANEFKSIIGKEVELYYNDDKFQTTPTLLGTIYIKKE